MRLCFLCLLWLSETLEDELEGELHLPAPLLVYIACKLARVVDVSIRRRTIHAVQHVISREPELNIESLADSADREILEECSVPVKLWPASENIAPQRSNMRAVNITREDP